MNISMELVYGILVYYKRVSQTRVPHLLATQIGKLSRSGSRLIRDAAENNWNCIQQHDRAANCLDFEHKLGNVSRGKQWEWLSFVL